MGLCRDQATNYLASLGYSVVRIPRENIRPLDLIGRDRDQLKLGTLDQLITNPGSLPEVANDQQAAHVSGQTSSKLKLGIGINILGNVLGALAGTQIGIKAAYNRAKTIQFEFTDVQYDSIEPLAVGQYLRNAEIDVDNPVLDRYVLGAGQLFLITEILKSPSITVKAEGSQESALSLDVPIIQQVAGANLEVDTGRASTGIVTYKGATNLTFGFKCFRVGVENGVLTLAAAGPNEVALAAGGGAPEAVLGAGMIELQPARL